MDVTALEEAIWSLRGAFRRQATFYWFVIVATGLLLRTDAYGVSSVVRALALCPTTYPLLLHFFHSQAWTAAGLMEHWLAFLLRQPHVVRVNGRLVLLGDDTKTPKDGRRMPGVRTLHQTSETSSKPSYFRGHDIGVLALLTGAQGRFFATAVTLFFHRQAQADTKIGRMLSTAENLATSVDLAVYLVLDAYFAAGKALAMGRKTGGKVQVLVRAKKNCVAYRPAPQPKGRPHPGRPRVYGRKILLQDQFRRARFREVEAEVYGKPEMVKVLVLDLIWKPARTTIRFFLTRSSRGDIVLMSSDLTLDPAAAIRLYGHRAAIETLFNAVKNILGGMAYHFWSSYLARSSRRPAPADAPPPESSRPERTEVTFAANEKFLAVNLVLAGILQWLACCHPARLLTPFGFWMRTAPRATPSEFVVRTALAYTLRENIRRFASDRITAIIRRYMATPAGVAHSQCGASGTSPPCEPLAAANF
jgi:hypothetical protein